MAVGQSSLTDTYGDDLTLTQRRLLDSGVVHDQVFTSVKVLDWLRKGNRIKVLNGGERIGVNLQIGKNPNYTRYSEYETIGIVPPDTTTRAWYNWKQAGMGISLSGKELRANGGQGKVRDLQKERTNNAMMSFIDNLATDIHSDGTADGSKQITGLQAAVPTSFTAAYAEVPTTNSYWQSQSSTTVGAAATNLLPEMRSAINSAEDKQAGSNRVDGLFTTFAIQETLEGLIQPAIRYGSGDRGEMSIDPVFRNVPIMADSYVPSGVMYGLSSGSIFFFVHREANISMTSAGFQQPVNSDSLHAIMILQANLALTERRSQVKWSGIT